MHGKESILSPIFMERLNASVIHTDQFDTDLLGSFSGDVARTLSPIDCAIKKAQIGCEITGLNLGLGSEGSFGPTPYGFGTMNHELIACINLNEDWLVAGHHFAPVSAKVFKTNLLSDIEMFFAQLPQHQSAILKLGKEIRKGLQDPIEGQDLLSKWKWDGSQTFELHYDFRAHHSKPRRLNIAFATHDLINRLLSNCPNCNCPGFWPDESVKGLPCAVCQLPTKQTYAKISRCQKCAWVNEELVEIKEAPPQYCDWCNP